ncbi:hypothetical protein SKAU_G00087180 [Synaphobranchus kaupii]|uniref:Galectin n=1 Tax=Synaphobranchus kaupii TaxID=118154 RepID=A0A9Q1FW00_SYNKA|nr:hypothetical protein SKAU_G00087180 [Synaphobranchus kaupii]
MVVFNTFKNGQFEEPEKVQEMPFTTGERFELVFIITSEGYQVNVNDHEFYMFKHRISVEQVMALAVCGDVLIESIIISGGSTDGEKGGGTGYNKGILPSMPYSSMIPGGMTEKKALFIRGKVLPEARRFEVNLRVSSSGNVAFHFNPRMNEASVVRNSLLGGNWGLEERHIDFNPFKKGQYFEIMMCCGKQKFEVFVNGKHLCDFVHRVKPFTLIDKLDITQDVQLFYVIF